MEEPLDADRPEYAPERGAFRDQHWGRKAGMAGALILVLAGGAWGFRALTNDSPPATPGAAVASGAPAKTCPVSKVYKASKMPKPTAISVRVVNATAQAGWATTNGAKIRERGFELAGVGNDTSNRAVNGMGELRYGDAGAAAAARLTYYMPGAKLIPVKRQGATVDVVLGPDFVRFQSIYEADQRAEKTDKVTVPLNPKLC